MPCLDSRVVPTFATVPRPRRPWAAALILLAALAPASAAWAEDAPPSGPIESGHTAIWYSPERSGEGFTLEILDAGRASLAWFTFDEEGNPRWAYALGQIVRGEDERVDFPDVFVSQGGTFAAPATAQDITPRHVGAATLRFADCNQGTFEVDAFGQQLSIAVRRLTRTMAAGCGPIHGIPGETIHPYAGQSGIWSDTERYGQGLQLQWTTRNQAILGWYTFDAEGNPYWLTGVGSPEGESDAAGNSKIVFPMLYAPRGARFGAAFDPADVEQVEWGSLELELSCDAGTLRFVSELPEFGSGERAFRLLTRSVPAACPWARPKLSDLYDITVKEIPMPTPTLIPGVADSMIGSSNVIFARSIANDGSVAGVEKLTSGGELEYRLRTWRYGAASWEAASDTSVAQTYVRIAPDGDVLLARNRWATSGIGATPFFLRNGLAEPLQGLVLNNNGVFGSSENMRYVVGDGFRPHPPTGGVESVPYTWSAEQGQVLLPYNYASFPTSVSNDGRVVVGQELAVEEVGPIGSGLFRIGGAKGLRWIGGNGPEYLRDSEGRILGLPGSCSADCGIVFGNYTGARVLFEDGSVGQEGEVPYAWYWRSPSDVDYLGPLAASEEYPQGWPYSVYRISGDGSLATGAYRAPHMVGSLPANNSATGGWIWTQNTGFVRVEALLEELGQALGWRSMHVADVSSNGQYLLLASGEVFEFLYAMGAPSSARAAVLHLVEKPRQEVSAQ